MCSVTIFGQLAWHWQIQCGNWRFSNVYLVAINYFNGQQNVNLRKLDSVTGLIWNNIIFFVFNFHIKNISWLNSMISHTQIYLRTKFSKISFPIISNLHLNKMPFLLHFQTNIFFCSMLAFSKRFFRITDNDFFLFLPYKKKEKGRKITSLFNN